MSGTVAQEKLGNICDGTTHYYLGKVLNGLEMNQNLRLLLKFGTEQEISCTVLEFLKKNKTNQEFKEK